MTKDSDERSFWSEFWPRWVPAAMILLLLIQIGGAARGRPTILEAIDLMAFEPDAATGQIVGSVFVAALLAAAVVGIWVGVRRRRQARWDGDSTDTGADGAGGGTVARRR